VDPKPLAAVLFDLDGTLVDSIQLILQAYRHTMRQHGRGELPDALWLAGLGKPLEVQLRELARDEAEIQAMRETFRSYYVAHHDALMAPYPGVNDALHVLRRRGLRLGVVTSKMRDTTVRTLQICKLDSYFEAVVTVSDVKAGKPHPEPVLLALTKLGAAPSEALFVGDSPFDMAAGRAADVAIAAATWGPFPRETLSPYAPDLWLERPEELAIIGSDGRNRPA
jgi:pyrophosphatase PpaX